MFYKSSEIQEKYRSKLVTAEEAAAMVKDGDRIHYGMGVGCSKDFDEALAKRINSLYDIEVVSLVTFTNEAYAVFRESEGKEHVRFVSEHMNGFDRQMQADGRCWYQPIMLREAPSYWGINGNFVDYFVIQVTPMDEHGNFNMGPSVADNFGIMKAAKHVIVEENPAMPFAFGENVINISEVDYVIQGKPRKMAVLPNKPFSDIDHKIASYVVDKIESGSTLQLGIGSLPNCIGALLCESDKGDFGCHTEMLADAYLALYNAGKLTGKKPCYDGKMVYTFAAGTEALYDCIDHNQICYAMQSGYTNDINVIASIDKFVSINGAMQVDLFGQVASEAIGPKQFSGTGGQLDFVQGAYMSKGGQSFITLPSARKLKDGSFISTISATLPLGSVVTTPRTATHYVVTEYGAVNLKGKDLAERAKLLISIAHPDFRDQLIEDAKKLGIWK